MRASGSGHSHIIGIYTFWCDTRPKWAGCLASDRLILLCLTHAEFNMQEAGLVIIVSTLWANQKYTIASKHDPVSTRLQVPPGPLETLGVHRWCTTRISYWTSVHLNLASLVELNQLEMPTDYIYLKSVMLTRETKKYWVLAALYFYTSALIVLSHNDRVFLALIVKKK